MRNASLRHKKREASPVRDSSNGGLLSVCQSAGLGQVRLLGCWSLDAKVCLEGWGLLRGGAGLRVAEFHEMWPGGRLADRHHFDVGSLITLDVMLREPTEGGTFQTLERGRLRAHRFHLGDVLVFVGHKYHSVSTLRKGSRRVLVLELWRGKDCTCGHRCDRRVARCADRRLRVAIDVQPRDAKVVLLFLHGWPDNAKVWTRQIRRFSALGYRCVAPELPNHGFGERSTWGYDFDVLASQLNNLAADLRSNGSSLVLVAHDWGAWLGYMAQRLRPELYDALVPLDVAPGQGAADLSLAWRVAAYQSSAAACYLLHLLPFGAPLADFLLRLLVSRGLSPLTGWEMPLTPTPLEEMSASMGFTYWHTLKPPRFFQWALWRTQGLQGWCDCSADAELKGELPSCPFLFLHGDLPSSRLTLAGKYFLQAVKRKGTKLQYTRSFPAHHWFHYWLADEVNAEIEGFLHQCSLGP
ncbi:unnamed protein product [Effrenium voratum]|nr:unnamed protein product [Effrenium voratum]